MWSENMLYGQRWLLLAWVFYTMALHISMS